MIISNNTPKYNTISELTQARNGDAFKSYLESQVKVYTPTKATIAEYNTASTLVVGFNDREYRERLINKNSLTTM